MAEVAKVAPVSAHLFGVVDQYCNEFQHWMCLDGANGRATYVAGSPDNCGNHAVEISKSRYRYTRASTDKIRTRYKINYRRLASR
ncbi:hypothetical protein Rhe02_29180 [Rhizocola hellebori]|uniref:Uncharacterized protein n=1 Tax=Rhizocola hellebori TaxID=1392758 RepID=A0A8J3Q7W8_9ACTN|nr:hypothetical protein Rhe02_29180 [Rhizocola hellebori]